MEKDSWKLKTALIMNQVYYSPMAKNKDQLLHPYIERILRQLILKDLANKGRPKWDKPHTECVVYWMKYLLQQLGPSTALNPKVLITAAYAHDWGYTDLFSRKNILTIDQARTKKKIHQQRGAVMIEQLIYRRLSSYFSETEVLRVTHLVSVHDDVYNLKDEDEKLLMECDALSMIDSVRVPPMLDATENEYLMRTSAYEKRLPLFVHDEAREIAEKLLKHRAKFYRDLESNKKSS